MDQQVIKLAEETLARYEALTQELSDPDIYSDQRRYAEVGRAYRTASAMTTLDKERVLQHQQTLDAVATERTTLHTRADVAPATS